ncbi:hypothetical protein ACWGHD_04385 [Streptomyces xanthophaeus]
MTDQPAECPDACIERHTYGPDCAATRDDYDPSAGMRERYAAALYQAGETRAFAPYLDREQAGELADAVLAARDVYLANVRRIGKQQTTQLAELYMATKKQAEQHQRRAIRIQTLLDEERDRARKDAAASRESERQLQQQIDQQAKEIDQLQNHGRWFAGMHHSTEADVTRVIELAERWQQDPGRADAFAELRAALMPEETP